MAVWCFERKLPFKESDWALTVSYIWKLTDPCFTLCDELLEYTILQSILPFSEGSLGDKDFLGTGGSIRIETFTGDIYPFLTFKGMLSMSLL